MNSLQHSSRFMKTSLAQITIEYLLLLGLLVVISLVAFRTMVPRAYQETNQAFNASVINIIGNPPKTSISGPWPVEDRRVPGP